MKTTVTKIYEDHHKSKRPTDYSLYKVDRAKFINSNIGIGKKVLDLGCRDGTLTKMFLSGNDVTGVDIDLAGLEKCRQSGIKTMEIDLNSDWHELQGNKFDVVVAGEILEHLYHPSEIMKKVSEHLNVGGIFIGSVPNAFHLKNRIRLFIGDKSKTPLQDETHINHFSHKELKTRLSKYFKEVVISPLGKYAKLDKYLPGMFSYDLLFVAKK